MNVIRLHNINLPTILWNKLRGLEILSIPHCWLWYITSKYSTLFNRRSAVTTLWKLNKILLRNSKINKKVTHVDLNPCLNKSIYGILYFSYEKQLWKYQNSRAKFRSLNLCVIGPARFHCATLLLNIHFSLFDCNIQDYILCFV